MALTKIEGGVCRIRMTLPSNQSGVTIGSGCVVRCSSFRSYFPAEETQSQSMLRDDVFIITSREVLAAAKGDLNSNTSLTAEFLVGKSGKLSSFTLDVAFSRDLPGRVLGLADCQTTNPGQSYSQFTVIPVECLDRRHKLLKKLRKFSLARNDRPLNCRRENEDNLKSLLRATQELFCYVLFDSGGTFSTEAYYLKLEDSEFTLTPVSGRSECFTKENDFSREGKPCGSVILNSCGECIGLLTLTVEDRKVLPLFLPTHENRDAAKNGKILTNADCEVLQEGAECSKEGHPSEGDKIVTGKSKATTCDTMDSNIAPHDGIMNLQRNDDVTKLGVAETEKSSTDDIPDRVAVIPDGESEDNVAISSTESDSSSKDTDDFKHNSCEDLCSEAIQASSSVSNLDAHKHERLGFHIQPTQHDQESMHAVHQDPGLGDDVSSPTHEATGTQLSSEEALRSYQRSQSEIPRSNNVPASVGGEMVSRSLSYSCVPARDCLQHVQPGSLLSTAIVSKIFIMDKLAEYLNNLVCPKGVNAIQCWPHLAELYNVPEDVKLRCQQYFSPSSNLFEYLSICDPISIGVLKKHLRDMDRGGVHDELQKTNLDDSASIKDLFDAHAQPLGRLCVKLDHGVRNWRDLGQRLGLPADKLQQFGESADCKPVETIFQIIQTKYPETTIKEIKDKLRDIKRGDVCDALVGLQDDDTVTTLYNNFWIWEKVTQLLQMETKGVNNWEAFAYKFGISKKLCHSLKPCSETNPTKSILEFIVQREPDVTVEDFIKKLIRMERNDVVKDVLKKFFYAEDIDRILRQLPAE